MYHPKKSRPNPVLWTILGGILLLHVVALAIFGGIQLYEYVKKSDTQFEEPPEVQKIERVKLEFRATMQQQQRQSARPKQRLTVNPMQNIQMPKVDVQVANLGTNTNFGQVGQQNLGGLGEGLGLSFSTVTIFDMTAKGEKFLFVIDVEPQLMVDARGGMLTYNVIKEELIKLVQGLPSGVLFNAIVFHDEAMAAWRPELQRATKDNKQEFKEWLTPINADKGNLGLPGGRNFTPALYEDELPQKLHRPARGGNAKTLIGLGILEMKPDVIYMFTNGLPHPDSLSTVDPEWTKEKAEEILEEKARERGYDSLDAWWEAHKEYNKKVGNAIAKARQKIDQQRKQKGLPPKIYTWQEQNALRSKVNKELGVEYVPRPHVNAPEESISEVEVKNYFEQTFRRIYDANDLTRPVFNAVIFRGKDEDWPDPAEEAVKEFVRLYRDGDHRVLRGLGAIDDQDFKAATATGQGAQGGQGDPGAQGGSGTSGNGN